MGAETESEATRKAPSDSGVTGRVSGVCKFFVFSGIGMTLMFVNVEIDGKSTILVQHFIDYLQALLGPYVEYYALAFVLGGGLGPLASGTWKRSNFDVGFTVVKLLGCVLGIMAVFEVGPAFLLEPDVIPFLFDFIVVPISLMIPVTLIALVLILNYGLLEFVSVFFEPIMRRVWRTPGSSALDAMISFTGGYALAVLVTNDLYKSGVYTAREACIIATGFSTVSVTFLVVIANTLELMQYWQQFFMACFVVTFAVTAVTARIYPLRSIPATWFDRPAEVQPADADVNILRRAFGGGVRAAQAAPPLWRNTVDYYKGDALKMTAAVTASILSVGVAGLLLTKYTVLFDLVAYIFYPVALVLGLPEPMLTGKAVGVEIAEMFIPSLLVVEADIVTKFVTAVVSVSAILFGSASIPCLLATDIPIRLRDIMLIWVERTILSLIFATPIAYWLF